MLQRNIPQCNAAAAELDAAVAERTKLRAKFAELRALNSQLRLRITLLHSAQSLHKQLGDVYRDCEAEYQLDVEYIPSVHGAVYRLGERICMLSAEVNKSEREEYAVDQQLDALNARIVKLTPAGSRRGIWDLPRDVLGLIFRFRHRMVCRGLRSLAMLPHMHNRVTVLGFAPQKFLDQHPATILWVQNTALESRLHDIIRADYFGRDLLSYKYGPALNATLDAARVLHIYNAKVLYSILRDGLGLSNLQKLVVLGQGYSGTSRPAIYSAPITISCATLCKCKGWIEFSDITIEDDPDDVKFGLATKQDVLGKLKAQLPAPIVRFAPGAAAEQLYNALE